MRFDADLNKTTKLGRVDGSPGSGDGALAVRPLLKCPGRCTVYYPLAGDIDPNKNWGETPSRCRIRVFYVFQEIFLLVRKSL